MKKNYLNLLKQQNLHFKKREKETGFDESIKINEKKKIFFFLGPENKWQKNCQKKFYLKLKKSLR